MNKFKIIFVLVFVFSFSAEAFYVRKLKEPDFFIPEGEEMHIQEKLPPVNVFKNQKDVYRENFVKLPEYKNKYRDYLKDIEFFAKNKVMPKNIVLENDLKAMESGEIFEVTGKKTSPVSTREQRAFNKLVDEIAKN